MSSGVCAVVALLVFCWPMSSGVCAVVALLVFCWPEGSLATHSHGSELVFIMLPVACTESLAWGLTFVHASARYSLSS